MLLGEILSRSYVGIQWLTSLPVQVSFELPDPMFCIQCWHNDYEKRKDISIQPHFVKISCYTDFATRIIQNFAGTLRAFSYERNWPGWPAYRDEFRLEFIWENSAGFRDEKRPKILGTSFGAKLVKQNKNGETQPSYYFCAYYGFGNPFSCITTVKRVANDVENSSGKAKRRHLAALFFMFKANGQAPVRAVQCLPN